jgi:hypothetical protein
MNGVHPYPVAEKRSTGLSAGRVHGNDTNGFVRLIVQEAQDYLVGER